MSSWINTTWGALATLEYGRALRGYQNGAGAVSVFGTNGPVGWTTEAQSDGPGVIVGRKGAYRGVHFSAGPFWVIDTAYYLRPKVEIDVHWAYYALLNVDINSMDSGSAIPSTSRADFYALQVSLPPLQLQRAIGEVLGALDDKIATNERMAEAIRELMALHYERSIGLDAQGKTLGDIAEVFDGPHATPQKVDKGPWFLSISSLDRGRLKLAESAHVSEDDYKKWTRRVTPHAGDVLFSYETRLGQAASMPAGIKACLGRRMALLRARPGKVDPLILLQAFLGATFQATISQRAVHGATVDRIPLIDLPGWPIMVPADRDGRLADVLAALGGRADCCDRENDMLLDLRNALLPKLISGEIRVRDAEKIVEDAT